jgi:tRNA (Thr-GGU) A37 N-methylase
MIPSTLSTLMETKALMVMFSGSKETKVMITSVEETHNKSAHTTGVVQVTITSSPDPITLELCMCTVMTVMTF